MKLYEINQAIRDAAAKVVEDGELTPESAGTLDALEMAWGDKVEQCAAMVCELEAQQEAVAREAKRLADKARSLDSRAKWLKDYILQSMRGRGMKKYQGHVHSLRIQANPAALTVLDAKLVPAQFFYQPEPVIEGKKILETLKAGLDVPGCEIRHGEHLRIV